MQVLQVRKELVKVDVGQRLRHDLSSIWKMLKSIKELAGEEDLIVGTNTGSSD